LIGINRPSIHNRIDPEAFAGLAKAYYQYDRDPSLRAAVLFGHGGNFSRGIDVEAFKLLAASGKPLMPASGVRPGASSQRLHTNGEKLFGPANWQMSQLRFRS
jgi:enoyl-CoA hydratase